MLLIWQGHVFVKKLFFKLILKRVFEYEVFATLLCENPVSVQETWSVCADLHSEVHQHKVPHQFAVCYCFAGQAQLLASCCCLSRCRQMAVIYRLKLC